MQDIITIGSSLIDIFVTSAHFELQTTDQGIKLCQMYGEKLEADSFEFHTGGGGGNAAVGFARAGFSVAVVTETGKDTTARLIMDDFHAEYVATNFVVQEKKEQSGGSVILVGKDGGRTVLVHRGASSLLDPQDIPSRSLNDSQWIHLSSIAGRLPTLQEIARASREGKTKLSWNPGQAELELLRTRQIAITDFTCQVLIMNQQEWESISELHESIKNSVAEIIITNGSKGGTLFLKGDQNAHTFTVPHTQVTDETGAGDAFAVGYVSGRLTDKSAQESIQWGARNSASVIQHFGAKAGLLSKEKLADGPESAILT